MSKNLKFYDNPKSLRVHIEKEKCEGTSEMDFGGANLDPKVLWSSSKGEKLCGVVWVGEAKKL